MQRDDAVAVVLRFRQLSALAAAAYLRPLPQGMTTVLRVAARLDENEIEGVAAGAGVEPEELHAACVGFLRHALFHAKADDYRLLGLSPGASSKQIQEHKRLLLGWLHPDRNTKQWERPLFRRVSEAAKRLQTYETRSERIGEETQAPKKIAGVATITLGATRTISRGWVIAEARQRRPSVWSWRRRLKAPALWVAFALFSCAALLASFDLQAGKRILSMAWSATPQFFHW